MKYSILLALSLAFSLPLYAGHKGAGRNGKNKPTREQIFNKRDTDHDGSLSKAEFTAKRKHQDKAEKAFAKRDTNGDGKLSLAEFTTKGKEGKKGKKGQKGNNGQKGKKGHKKHQ